MRFEITMCVMLLVDICGLIRIHDYRLTFRPFVVKKKDPGDWNCTYSVRLFLFCNRTVCCVSSRIFNVFACEVLEYLLLFLAEMR